MTVLANDRRTPVYVTTGGETLLPYDFLVRSAADLAVWRLRGGGVSRLVLGVDYTLSGVGSGSGGNVQLITAAVAGDKYLAKGDTAPVRAADIAYQSAIAAPVLNGEYDHLQRQLAEIRSELARKLGRSEFDETNGKIELPQGVVGYLYMDAQGNLQIVAGTSGGGALSLPLSIAEGGTGADDAAEARTNLGLGALATKSIVGFVDIASGVVRFDVESRTVTVPPSLPQVGKLWIIPAGASGVWAGKAGQVAIGGTSAWTYYVPAGGETAYAKDTQTHLGYKPASGWGELGGAAAAATAGDGRIVGRFQGNGQGGAAVRGWWTADNRIFMSGLGTGMANADPAVGSNWFVIQIPWDKTLGIKRVYSSNVSHYLIDANDEVWSWGGNASGQLGHGDTTNRWLPTKIAFFSGIDIAEVIPSRVNSSALETTIFRELGGVERVWGCGNGANYVFGNAATTQQNTPIQIGGFLQNVKEVAFDNNLGPCFFRLADGQIVVTGGPSGTANGLGTGAPAQTPTSIPLMANEGIVKMAVAAAAAGVTAACLLKSNGTPLVCGYGGTGLGLGNTSTLATFTPITSIPSSEVLVDVSMAAGTGIALAFRSSVKNLHLCGYGANGIRGDGSTTNMLSLVKPAGAYQGAVDEIAVGGSDALFTVALRAGADLWTCGNDANGQTGQGDYNLAATARTWRKVQGLDGTIAAWGWNGAYNGAGLSVVLVDGRAKAAGLNTSGETGTQPGNLHVVSTLQDVKGLPDIGKGDPGAAGAGYGGTSVTSLAIGTGSKTFVTQAGKAYQINDRVRAKSAADAAKYMEGLVTSYAGETLVVNVLLTGGTGTAADWNISLAAEPGIGTGDVNGPASSVNGRVAIFSGTTGKLIADGGKALPAGALVGDTDPQTLSNKTLTAPTLNGPTTASTGIAIPGSTSGSTSLVASAAASGTMTLPAATDTLVGRNTNDTLANKTLTAPTVNNGTFNSPTLVTPALGTPASGNLANCTGLVAGSDSQIQIKSGSVFAASAITATTGGDLTLPTGGILAFGGDTLLRRVAANMIGWGGNTSAHPAIKRNATAIDFRLADDSNYAPVRCMGLDVYGAQVMRGALGANSQIAWNGGASIRAQANGVMSLLPDSGTAMRVQYGGTTSSFPALKVNGAGLDVRVADDTAASFITASYVKVGSYTVATVPSASGSGAGAIIYVSDESGGATTAFSDATNWRRHSDRAVIS